MRIVDDTGSERDFFFEMSKYAGHLYKSHIERHLAIYELYKKTYELPGSVAEFGLYNGSTFFFLARLLEIFNKTSFEIHESSSHHLYGFDTFEGIVNLSDLDSTDVHTPQKHIGGFKQINNFFLNDLDHFKKTNCSIAKRIHIIKGDATTSFPDFLKQNPGVRFRFVILDMDVFEPTNAVLDSILNFMVPGGIIAFDEYGFPEWPGETIAADQFIRKNHLKLTAIPWACAPAAYCVIGN